MYVCYIYVCMYECMYVYMYICMKCMYVYMYVCMRRVLPNRSCRLTPWCCRPWREFCSWTRRCHSLISFSLWALQVYVCTYVLKIVYVCMYVWVATCIYSHGGIVRDSSRSLIQRHLSNIQLLNVLHLCEFISFLHTYIHTYIYCAYIY